MTDSETWNAHYRGSLSSEQPPPKPSRVLQENHHLLPPSGTALDVATGRGGNALLLSRFMDQTLAWDFSEVVVSHLNEYAERLSLPLLAELRDVTLFPPETNRFDCVVVSRFLHRPLARFLVDALKPGGILFYQTFTREKVTSTGPNNPDFLLEPNELLHMFSRLRLFAYREEGTQGNGGAGWRNEALFVGQKVD